MVDPSETPTKYSLDWLKFAVVCAKVASVEYVNLSAVATVEGRVIYPPAKYPFIPSPEHPAKTRLAWLKFAVV